MEYVKIFLKYFGIDVALIVAGIMGSLVQVGGKEELGFFSKLTVLISGGAIANYLTPLMIDWLKWSESSRYGFGFLLGFMGLKGVEWIIRSLQKKLGYDTKNDTKDTEI